MWTKLQNNLKSELGAQTFNNWFNAVSLGKYESDELILNVPNQSYKEHIESHYLDVIKKVLFNITQKNTAVYFKILEKNLDTVKPIKKTNNTYFNPKFSFSNFIVGGSNSFAHAVCMAVAESPGHAYNPLFIYGKVGLGKTHLLQAIGYEIQQKYPESIILYISSEKFANELINALQHNKTEEFRQKYRNIDLLLIDDIQFIAGKERTQEEFFHTFNHLHNDNKQIVMTSDKPPKEIAKLEERLVSRFEWGITADVQPPDYETRIAILNNKAATMRIPVPQNVIEFIAANFKSNIRELEGALTKVVANSSAKNIPVSIEKSQEILADSIILTEKTISVLGIQQIVAEHFDLTVNDLNSSKRSKTLVYPRQLAMYLCRKITSCSFPEIGGKFGGKDHSTVIHAYEKIQQKCNNDSSVENLIKKLEEKILA